MKKTKITAADRTILRYLDLAARTPTTELGKRIRKSPEAVRYRITRLENAGVIKGYHTLINFGRLGYTGFGVYAKLANVNGEHKRDVLHELAQDERIYWIAEFGGKYDIAFAIMAQNVVVFNNILTDIMGRFSVLKDPTIAIRVELVQYSREYLAKGDHTTPFFSAATESIEVDDVDHQILSRLAQNGREPLLQIAGNLKRPVSTIMQRVKRLEDEEIIQGYATMIDCRAYAYESYQFFLNTPNLSQDARSRLRSYCEHHPNIVFFIETIGPWQFELIYEIESHDELQRLAIELRTTFQEVIQDLDIIILYDHYVKYNQYPVRL